MSEVQFANEKKGYRICSPSLKTSAVANANVSPAKEGVEVVCTYPSSANLELCVLQAEIR